MSAPRWRRLWQPSRGLFWMMLGFNVLSSVCSWALRALPLNTVGLLLIGGVALMNVVMGLAAAWALLKTPTAAEEAAAESTARHAEHGAGHDAPQGAGPAA